MCMLTDRFVRDTVVTGRNVRELMIDNILVDINARYFEIKM